MRVRKNSSRKPVAVDELIAAFDRISIQRAGTGNAKNRGCVCIGIAGASGGVGSTSLAVNLGCALAADEANSVALIDLDMSLGDADVFLDTIPGLHAGGCRAECLAHGLCIVEEVHDENIRRDSTCCRDLSNCRMRH